jgi:hypothetical protein
MTEINLDKVTLVGIAQQHVRSEVVRSLSPWRFGPDHITAWASTDEDVLEVLTRLKASQLGNVTSILVQGLKPFEKAYGTKFGYAFSIADAVTQTGISIPTIHLGKEREHCTFAGEYHLGWEDTLKTVNTPFAQLLMDIASQQSSNQIAG